MGLLAFASRLSAPNDSGRLFHSILARERAESPAMGSASYVLLIPGTAVVVPTRAYVLVYNWGGSTWCLVPYVLARKEKLLAIREGFVRRKPPQSQRGERTHLSVDGLRDDLPRFMPEASRLRTRDGCGSMCVAKQRQHVVIEVPLDARHSSTRGSPVRVDKRLQPERCPKRRVSADQAQAKTPGRLVEGVGAVCRRRHVRGGTNS